MSFLFLTPDKLLEETHPARIIDKIVETLDLQKIIDSYKNEGNVPYNPKMQLKVLFYAYYIGAMSCRKIWDNLQYRADFIFLSGNQVPNFRTINDFRKRHIDLIPDLFSQIVHLCCELEMVDFQYLAIDGQKIKANANFRNSKNKERLEKSLKRVKEGLKKLVEKEVNEDFTDEIKKKREEKLRFKEKKLEELKKTLDEINDKNANVNSTDKEAVVMKHKDGRSMPSYNHISSVDGQFGVTVAVKTKDSCDCSEDLFDLVEKSKENTKNNEIKNVLADPSFVDYPALEKMEEMKENFFVPDKRFEVTEKEETSKGKYDKSNFKFNDKGDLICPEGKKMDHKWTKKINDSKYEERLFECSCSRDCPNREMCTKSEKRKIVVDGREVLREKMRDKLRSDNGREIYIKRQGIVEPGHGNDQKNKGWIQHNLRGTAKATLEFLLVRIGDNLGKIVKYRGNEALAI